REGRGRALADGAQQRWVQRPWERPGQVQLVEGVLVDRDDDDRRAGRPGAAESEAEIQALELEELERPRQREEPREGAGGGGQLPRPRRAEPGRHGFDLMRRARRTASVRPDWPMRGKTFPARLVTPCDGAMDVV